MSLIGLAAAFAKAAALSIAAASRPVLTRAAPASGTNSDAGATLNLDAADQEHGVDQTGVRFGDLTVFVDEATRHRRPDAQAALRVAGQLVEFGDVLDVYEQVDVAPVFADLHDDVGAAGEAARSFTLGGQGGAHLADSLGGD